MSTATTAFARDLAEKRGADRQIPFLAVMAPTFSAYGTAENPFKCDPVHFKPELEVPTLNAEVLPVALRALQEKTNRLAAIGR